jgi:hypothetical protein
MRLSIILAGTRPSNFGLDVGNGPILRSLLKSAPPPPASVGCLHVGALKMIPLNGWHIELLCFCSKTERKLKHAC